MPASLTWKASLLGFGNLWSNQIIILKLVIYKSLICKFYVWVTPIPERVKNKTMYKIWRKKLQYSRPLKISITVLELKISLNTFLEPLKFDDLP